MANVRVNINLTTSANFNLQQQAIAGEEVVVTAEAPIVQPDISANVANVSAAELINIPITGVSDFVNLQAGIEDGMNIRGSGSSGMAFIVDGANMRTGRGNSPFTNISFTAIEEMQIQTGGFNAEYGNVRSGVLNVVNKKPGKDRYSANVMLRYTPVQSRTFDKLANDSDSYWVFPFRYPNVRYVGAQEGLDVYDQRQYVNFEGWNEISRIFNEDEDPTNDLTPDQLLKVWDWQHRKGLANNEYDIDIPDYIADATITGPVPFIGKSLGNLRFLASYRKNQTAYIIPQSLDRNENWTAQFKVYSDLSQNMRLQMYGMMNEVNGMTNTSGVPTCGIWGGSMPSYPWGGSGIMDDVYDDEGLMWAWHKYNEAVTKRNNFGIEFTHTLSPKTFYKVRFQRMYDDYLAGLGELRDPAIVKTVGAMELDEAPWGWVLPQTYDVSGGGGFDLGGSWGEARDTSTVAVYTGNFDIESQLNQSMQIKAGIEFNYNDFDINARQTNDFLTIQSQWNVWQRQPIQAAAYAQTKLEFQGMIANLGFRMDYFDPTEGWIDHTPYDANFSAKVGVANLENEIEKRTLDKQVYLSPRMGVAFPITVNSKLFFNYGHFRQIQNLRNMFRIQGRHLGYVEQIGNPDLPMQKTVAYELGYEHNIADQYLLRVNGYYKDEMDEPQWVRFLSRDLTIDYEKRFPYAYSDTRGLEFTLEKKRRGSWYGGFVNYTFMARSTGDFGYEEHFESLADQRNYERTATVSQDRLIPQPFGRFNIEFYSPTDIGPKVAGVSLLGDWALNFLGEYRSGRTFRWTDGSDFPGLDQNVQWQDFYNLDLRLTKHLKTGIGNLQVFMDVENVFNKKYLHDTYGFNGDEDWEHYMRSLHLPTDIWEEFDAPYSYVPGDDEPGDFRDFDVKWVPIEVVGNVDDLGDPLTRPLYYETDSKTYKQWSGSEWKTADQGTVDQVLDDKAYIDMPNQQFFTFVNARIFRIGLRLNF
jgi:outer membrane receptor protein involved in Fe transport